MLKWTFSNRGPETLLPRLQGETLTLKNMTVIGKGEVNREDNSILL